jgi:thioredoxin reductase (NADPH)
MKIYDVIVVGAGPAGLTAALYARRAEKSVLVLEKETFGGQITYSPKVENYPGMGQISGGELGDKMLDQAVEHGADIELETVTGIRAEGELRYVDTDCGTHAGRTVILATGSRHRPLGLAREEELVGRGISYCAVCDGAFYSGKEVAVIGGGNTALQDAVLLADRCTKVTIVQNLDDLTGEKRLADKLRANPAVEIRCHTVVEELVGDDVLRAIRLRDTQTGAVSELAVDGVFVAIGQIPANGPFAALVPLSEAGYLQADESCTTPDPAVFAAGDCRTKTVRQVATAVGDGAVAAIAACRYLDRA